MSSTEQRDTVPAPPCPGIPEHAPDSARSYALALDRLTGGNGRMKTYTPTEDNPPPCRAQATATIRGARLPFPGGAVDTSTMRQAHPNGTPTTIRNAKLARPAEAYPGEAERMLGEWTRLAVAAIQRARDATTGPRLVSELEEARHAVGEALRWAKP